MEIQLFVVTEVFKLEHQLPCFLESTKTTQEL